MAELAGLEGPAGTAALPGLGADPGSGPPPALGGASFAEGRPPSASVGEEGAR